MDRTLDVTARHVLRAVLLVALAAVYGCTSPAPPAPVVAPEAALIGRYATNVGELGLAFTIDAVEQTGDHHYRVTGRARGMLADTGGPVECTFDQTGEISYSNIDLTFTPGADCPYAFGSDAIMVRYRLKLSGYATEPDWARGHPVEADPY